MKKIIYLLLLCCLLQTGCQKDDLGYQAKYPLVFSVKVNNLQNNASNSILLEGVKIHAIIKSQDSTYVKILPYNNKKSDSKTSYLSQGHYILTSFIMEDEKGTKIYAAPRSKDSLSRYVLHPLPLDFTIDKHYNKVSLQVLPYDLVKPSVDKSSEDVGFSIQIIQLLGFYFAVYDKDTQRRIPYHLKISGSMHKIGLVSQKINIFWDEDMPVGIFRMAVPAKYKFFRFQVEAKGYKSAELIETREEIKKYKIDDKSAFSEVLRIDMEKT